MSAVAADDQISLAESAIFIAIFCAAYPLIAQLVDEAINLLFIAATTNVPLLDYDGDGTRFWERFNWLATHRWMQAPAILLIAAVLVRFVPNVWAGIPLMAILLLSGEMLFRLLEGYVTDPDFQQHIGRYLEMSMPTWPSTIAFSSAEIAGAFGLVHLYARFRSRTIRDYLL